MKIKHSKKRYMTLLELMIASSLTIALLVILGYFYRQSIFLDQTGEILQKASFQSRYVETRLMQVIPMIERHYFANHDTHNAHYYFFSENDLGGLSTNGSSSLVFVYETDSDIKPKNSVRALGRLFVDKHSRLILATWPSPEIWETVPPTKAKLEVLLENVTDLKFNFYNPPSRDRKKSIVTPLKDEVAVEPTNEWPSEWKQEYHYLPPLMKIMVTYKPLGKQEGQTSTYAFPLPKSTKIIVYE